MDATELRDRLSKLHFALSFLTGRPAGQLPGRIVPESWQYHVDTLKAAINHLKECQHGKDQESPAKA